MDPNDDKHLPTLTWSLLAAGLVLPVVAWMTLSPAQLTELLLEGNAQEALTAWAWGLAAVLLAVVALRAADWRTPLALMVVFIAFGARELDLHKTLTGTSVLRVSWYLNGPFTGAKAIALAVIAAFALALFYLLWRHARRLPRNIRQGEPLAVLTGVFIAALVVSKVMDRTSSVLAEDFGMPPSVSAMLLLQAWEETLELVLPLLVAGAAWPRARRAAWPRARAVG